MQKDIVILSQTAYNFEKDGKDIAGYTTWAQFEDGGAPFKVSLSRYVEAGDILTAFITLQNTAKGMFAKVEVR